MESDSGSSSGNETGYVVTEAMVVNRLVLLQTGAQVGPCEPSCFVYSCSSSIIFYPCISCTGISHHYTLTGAGGRIYFKILLAAFLASFSSFDVVVSLLPLIVVKWFVLLPVKRLSETLTDA